MNMDTMKADGVLVVRPMEKRIDAATALDFKGTMVNYISSGNMKIVLDLSNVDFVDSTGLGMIVSTLKTLGRDGIMAICSPTDIVSSLFHLTRMHRLFDIVPTVEEAVGKVKGYVPPPAEQTTEREEA